MNAHLLSGDLTWLLPEPAPGGWKGPRDARRRAEYDSAAADLREMLLERYTTLKAASLALGFTAAAVHHVLACPWPSGGEVRIRLVEVFGASRAGWLLDHEPSKVLALYRALLDRHGSLVTAARAYKSRAPQMAMVLGRRLHTASTSRLRRLLIDDWGDLATYLLLPSVAVYS